jgi:MoxR-like ATPase
MFVSRKEEGRAVMLSVRAGRGVVLAAPPGYGKTALVSKSVH